MACVFVTHFNCSEAIKRTKTDTYPEQKCIALKQIEMLLEITRKLRGLPGNTTTTLPILNPRFRPNLPEIKDAGMVAAIKPKNCKANRQRNHADTGNLFAYQANHWDQCAALPVKAWHSGEQPNISFILVPKYEHTKLVTRPKIQQSRKHFVTWWTQLNDHSLDTSNNIPPMMLYLSLLYALELKLSLLRE